MSDSIERLFPISPAGSSKFGSPPAVAHDERATAQQPAPRNAADRHLPRHVGPIPAHILRQIANDDWAHNRRPVPDQPTFREGAVWIGWGATCAILAAAAIAYAQSKGWIAQ